MDMKNIKTWHVLLSVGIIGKFISYIIQYMDNNVGSRLADSLGFMFGALLLFISIISLMAGLISFLLHLTKFKSFKDPGLKKEFIIFICFVLVFLLILYIEKLVPALPYHW